MKAVLTIAGSDSGGGAGIQADLKTFEAFGVFGTSAVTVLTAQNTRGVYGIFPVSAEFVIAQAKAVLKDFEISAIKLGMLFNREIIEAIGGLLDELKGRIPVVLDPVAVSRAGSVLLEPDAEAALKTLFERCTVATPNRYEFKRLIGGGDFKTAGQAFVDRFGCALVAKNRQEAGSSTDWLFQPRAEPLPFTTPLASNENTHGTGCTFAAALTALLALGKPLDRAVKEAKNYVYEAITRAPNLGQGNGPVRHRF